MRCLRFSAPVAGGQRDGFEGRRRAGRRDNRLPVGWDHDGHDHLLLQSGEVYSLSPEGCLVARSPLLDFAAATACPSVMRSGTSILAQARGHADVAFTMRTYVHSQPNALADGAQSLARVVTIRDNSAGA